MKPITKIIGFFVLIPWSVNYDILEWDCVIETCLKLSNLIKLPIAKLPHFIKL